MLAPGTFLQNRYEIVRLIGEGGMGAVYLARDQRLDSPVALKQTLFTDERLSKAFERGVSFARPAAAATVCYLLSDEARYVNGANIHLSGAWGV